MKFPDGFQFKKPLECYVIELDPALADLPCYNEDSVLVMKDLKQTLAVGTYRIKMRNIINPKIATPLTGNFLFESMKEGIYTVIEYYDNVAGVLINPGTITDVSIIGFPLV